MRVLYLNPGSYSVAAELSGFKKFVRVENEVRVGDVIRVDVVLEAGGVSETVSVVANARCSTPAPASAAPRWTASRSPNCRSATAPPTC